ncbi:MAG: MBL fold metallo-hydrolase [Deltaproteobacteria bacterium]|nr:MBL fold metallo-hydrolase [Deltaproteobacteria bacterium]
MERTQLGYLRTGQKRLERVNPVPGIWMIPSFGNTGVVETEEGLVLIDVPIQVRMEKTMTMLREVLDAPVHSIFFTHGHLDHAVTLDPLFDEAERNGSPVPRTIAHRNLVKRFNRYRMLDGYHEYINRVQFAIPDGVPAFPLPKRNPDIIFDQSLSMQIGGLDFHAFHAKGETDDHLWLWVPERKTVFVGDLIVSSFPNVGNPFKVQRYTLDWAEGLEAVAGKEPEILVPGHGAVIQGNARIKEVCLKTAEALRYLHDEVVKRLNSGMWYEDILHDITLPDKYTKLDFLTPIYGCPRFVIHGILRQYTGWYDGNPSNLFPPKRRDINREIIAITGKDKITAHARSLKDKGCEDMALQFVDMALAADNNEDEAKALHTLKAKLIEAVGEKEGSLIARNIYHNGYKQEAHLL